MERKYNVFNRNSGGESDHARDNEIKDSKVPQIQRDKAIKRGTPGPSPPRSTTSSECYGFKSTARRNNTSIILNMENSQIRISAYKPPKIHTSSQDYDNILDSLPSLLAGDLNSKHVPWGCRKSNAEGPKVRKYARDLNLEIFAPSEPTHFHYRTPDILDIALTKDISHTIILTNSGSFSSDHNPISININEQYAYNPLARIPHIDWDALSYYLGEAQSRTWTERPSGFAQDRPK
ncbi:uncharacterized protein LOC125505392 [Dendroctonus ponderosae]|uniref:uncharacterized protein LOC125505392 n=1 Tax=Dendroctonus ponderosae TaxID=77166 RepID=UPI00203615CC|nr:uncharacterized protein LOC125505392 [Dendroctonus ponderosae]